MECKICEVNFHVDEINECPECGIELCPTCYENHVTGCTLGEWAEDYDDYEESTIPRECPECQNELLLDPDQDGAARVICEECNWCQELTSEQIAELDKELD